MLHIAGVNYESIADAPGVCCVIFFSGCRHACRGCHSPKTHDFNYGVPATKEIIKQINQEIKKRPYLSGLVLSGGDPMYSAKEVNAFLDQIIIPHDRIWCFTGFKVEELLRDNEQRKLLSRIQVLVDGPFVLSQRDITLNFRGSRNQRLIDAAKTLKSNRPVLYQPSFI